MSNKHEQAQEVARQLKDECTFPELLTDAEVQEAIDTNGAECSIYDVRWYLN